ncbi:uncharacterized protein PFL1_02468 [Pseudozyma flocculosa PF-1]|uniref:Uncharacterized protein n=2 Tax=Pseudozyma flocculosa TaxID=84751 RepID=A0A5C3EZ76_9BASI|nr:uncharacterized protein PFL1_02468 [Pseudozyma flocculosa PF-1]EPQ29795.1 hypothetical protein PFL1_02468 [Pseudozyma flocculosa PF-1]SPO37085.1 uncharacterized protein PSFLO_02557 [Pseudozyma flocculosa]
MMMPHQMDFATTPPPQSAGIEGSGRGASSSGSSSHHHGSHPHHHHSYNASSSHNSNGHPNATPTPTPGPPTTTMTASGEKQRHISSINRSQRSRERRQEVLKHWYPCERCIKQGIACVPPPLLDPTGKQSSKLKRCMHCASPTINCACSTGKALWHQIQLPPTKKRKQSAGGGGSTSAYSMPSAATSQANASRDLLISGTRAAILNARTEMDENPESKNLVAKLALSNIEALFRQLDPDFPKVAVPAE